MIEDSVKKLLNEIPEKNPFGEKVTLVAAVKTQTPEDINRAISAGITDIGDNHVQEFRDKFDEILPSKRHFIGTLQTNKIKYLLGKVDLYHSVDRFSLAEELDKKSGNQGLCSSVLLEVNVGCELTKSGFSLEEASSAYEKIKTLKNLKICGLMGMLPLTDDEQILRKLATAMRAKYDEIRKIDGNFEFLSMGMSGDWKICIECGSNLIRLGTSIFGARSYNK